MICEVRNDGHEVVLRHVTFSDLLAMIYLWLHKDKEIAFSKPEEVTDGEEL